MFTLSIFRGNGTNMCPDPASETEPASLHVIEYILVTRWQLQHQNQRKNCLIGPQNVTSSLPLRTSVFLSVGLVRQNPGGRASNTCCSPHK